MDPSSKFAAGIFAVLAFLFADLSLEFVKEFSLRSFFKVTVVVILMGATIVHWYDDLKDVEDDTIQFCLQCIGTVGALLGAARIHLRNRRKWDFMTVAFSVASTVRGSTNILTIMIVLCAAVATAVLVSRLKRNMGQEKIPRGKVNLIEQ